MNTLFSGKFPVQWWRGYIWTPNFDGMPRDGFRGQKNGLLGVADPDYILMYFGCHTAFVDLEIKLYEERPVLEDKWEEVAEASFLVRASVEDTSSTSVAPHGKDGVKLSLGAYLGGLEGEFNIPEGSYRLRYCARNFGALESDVEECPDQNEYYDLSFWTAPMGSEEIVRVTRDRARRRHEIQGIVAAKDLP